jgi:hypothetical protein
MYRYGQVLIGITIIKISLIHNNVRIIKELQCAKQTRLPHTIPTNQNSQLITRNLKALQTTEITHTD